MKPRFERTMLAGLAAVFLAAGGGAATRIGSVYVENVDELQRQCSRAAALYEAPALDALPKRKRPANRTPRRQVSGFGSDVDQVACGFQTSGSS